MEIREIIREISNKVVKINKEVEVEEEAEAEVEEDLEILIIK